MGHVQALKNKAKIINKNIETWLNIEQGVIEDSYLYAAVNGQR